MNTKTASIVWVVLFAVYWAFLAVATENEPWWISPVVAAVTSTFSGLLLGLMAETTVTVRTSDTVLRGGQLWEQDEFPCFRCYLVYMSRDRWCRISPPLDGRGCTTFASETGVDVYSGDELLMLLREHKYTLKGQYYDCHSQQTTTSEVTFIGGPLDGERRQISVNAESFCCPERAPPNRDGDWYRAVEYDRNEDNPHQFIYRRPSENS